MEIRKIITGVYAVNSYILFDESSKETAVIDPGGDEQEITDEIDKLGGSLKYVILTHGHFDHTGGVYGLVKKSGAKLIINKKDEDLVLGKENVYGPYSPDGSFVKADFYVKEGDEFYLGENKIRAIETPGHTPGGMSYYTEGNLFSGDTLFLLSVGRCDLYGGDYNAIISSIKDKLFNLPEDTVVYPGHGPKTLIKNEKRFNQFVK
ncbi:MAG: MBL fold metallo-hydrolase [Bacillota bacterium]|nr:MBL fold metallo-hydrolase [Bacillota bacterium]